MPTITTERLIDLLSEYVREQGRSVDLLLVGALALQAYGWRDRPTQDVDGEVAGPLEPLVTFLMAHGVPADLSEDISGWSIVSMPPGYRDRTTDLVARPNLRIRLLAPVDFVIAKLRRGTDLDLEDAAFVVKRFGLTPTSIQAAAETAIAASRQDTALFLFRKTVDLFCRSLADRQP